MGWGPRVKPAARYEVVATGVPPHGGAGVVVVQVVHLPLIQKEGPLIPTRMQKGEVLLLRVRQAPGASRCCDRRQNRGG